MQNTDPLLSGTCDRRTQDMKNYELISSFFALVFTDKVNSQDFCVSVLSDRA